MYMDLVNKTFLSGVFPDKLKIEQVGAIFQTTAPMENKNSAEGYVSPGTCVNDI